jgi:hypothetical protein
MASLTSYIYVAIDYAQHSLTCLPIDFGAFQVKGLVVLVMVVRRADHRSHVDRTGGTTGCQRCPFLHVWRIVQLDSISQQ